MSAELAELTDFFNTEAAGLAEIGHSDGLEPSGSPREARQGMRRDLDHKRLIEVSGRL